MPTARHVADIDREDRIVFGLTTSQAVKLGGVATVLFVVGLMVWRLTHQNGLATGLTVVVSCIVLGLSSGAVVVTKDGVPLDRYLLRGLRHRFAPSVMVPASGEGEGGRKAAMEGAAPLLLPTTPQVLADGAVDLGERGSVVICRASSLTFQLRSENEQEGLVTAFGAFLNSLAGPIQIAIRSEPVDTETWASEIEAGAERLPGSALRQAARAHAAFLREQGEGQVRRQALVVVREEERAAGAELVRQRADAAVDDLSAAGIGVSALEHRQVVNVLAAAMNPGEVHRVTLGLARLDEPIRRAKQ
jgi:hypothetical protein